MKKLIPWFVLRSVPGVGNLLYKRLIAHLKSPENILNADIDHLMQVEGVSKRLAKNIVSQSLTDSVKRELDVLAAGKYDILTLNDEKYPALLAQIADPPPFLYIYGDLGECTQNLAVVGSRNATDYGLFTTEKLCAELSALNITVVSGLARGIDTAAHKGAIEGGGKTIAVLGSGFERVYPLENLNLFHAIAESGAVITEFPLKARPDSYRFPIRNRIISGISLGVMVVEAAKKSGSLITARMAVEQDREVFAVPGNIHSFKSAGTHNLIKQGAKLVESAQDILEELPHLIKSHIAKDHICQEHVLKHLPQLLPEEAQVFKALSPYPVHIDELVRKLDTDPAKLSGLLLQLELKGVVAQSPGMMFSIKIDQMLGNLGN